VGADGEQIGVVSTQDALRQARDLDLDLVEVAPQADPPVCRIMDYGKYKYERDIRQKEARKKQSRVEVKEIKFRPKIDRHDYATKKGHVERFLRHRDKVKITIMFRGREQSHPERGRDLLMRLAEDVKEIGQIESPPLQDGRNMVMLLGPTKAAGQQVETASA
jgi:translation initiation factor IF-3